MCDILNDRVLAINVNKKNTNKEISFLRTFMELYKGGFAN
jgi:hypothetical protein